MFASQVLIGYLHLLIRWLVLHISVAKGGKGWQRVTLAYSKISLRFSVYISSPSNLLFVP